jgi:hypothetical protein
VRIEAHIFIAFLAYCLHVTLGRRLRALAPGLTPRSAIKKFAAVQMIDLHVSTTDGHELLLTRYTEPEPELALLMHKLKLALPPTSRSLKSPLCPTRRPPRCSADLCRPAHAKQSLKPSRPRQSAKLGSTTAPAASTCGSSMPRRISASISR